ncbi:MBL fold metallo-hydrolase [Arthrospiribacter ruber]|uniref:MBL fold metallo-hydrolase n=1 Tax=Arthrospiribacter ruber TaxID=2487934 RepID=A0A951M6I9_9BACT|nr:MBL fold metallo-hydrolase [Arthrospiribacter ruber]MBW3466496.1 MBL fold metallo-hydrolase [Arthrospiribacter ruber]
MREKIHINDLKFLETEEAIACFLIETTSGPIMIETGPESTFPQLEKGITDLGWSLKEIQGVFLSHIHFDHAGAAWKLAALGVDIYLHPAGVPHLHQPEKLWNSAAQIYGDQMEYLWGKMEPIPQAKLKPVSHLEEVTIGNVKLKSLHTPGHASHHISWMVGDVIFTGDVAGVKIGNGHVVPPCPPPDIHLEDWKKSLDILRKEDAKMLFLTHFGRIDEISRHLDHLENTLDTWALWIKPHFENNRDQKEIIPEFMKFTQQQLRDEGCTDELIKVYEYANPSWMSVAGLYRYWKLKSQGRIQ